MLLPNVVKLFPAWSSSDRVCGVLMLPGYMAAWQWRAVHADRALYSYFHSVLLCFLLSLFSSLVLCVFSAQCLLSFSP